MPRFTLRDLFWLTLVVGLGVGWWMDHRRGAKARSVADTLTRNLYDKGFDVIESRDGNVYILANGRGRK